MHEATWDNPKASIILETKRNRLEKFLEGGCSGPRLRATEAFVKRAKWFTTYFRC